MKKTVLVIIIVIFSASLFAQVSGYMGKRLSIEYNNMFLSALRNPTNGNYNHTDRAFNRILKFNTRNNISLDYVISRRRSIGIGADFFKTRFTLYKSFDLTYIDMFGQEKETSTSISTIPVCNISSTCFNLHYTFFNKEALAPLGRYGQIEFGLIRYVSTYDKDKVIEKLEKHYNEITEISIEDNNISLTTYMGFTLGRKRVYFNRLIVNSGIQICVIPEVFSLRNIFSNNNIINIGNINESNYLENIGKERIFNHMLINLKVGVGLLAI